MDFTAASMNIAGGLSVTVERPLSNNVQMCAASFEVDLQAAQLVSVPEGIWTCPPDVPLDDPETSDLSEELSPTEQMMWLGVALPLPIELCSSDTMASSEVDTVPLVPNESKPTPRSELTHWIERGLAPVGEPREALSSDSQSVLIDPVIVDRSTLDPELRSTPDPMSPAIVSPFSTMDEQLLADSPLNDVRLPVSDQTPAPPTVDENLPAFDAPTPNAENSVTIDRPTGFFSQLSNEAHTNELHAATESTHSPRGISGEPRTELSEVVRQVRTMVTEHETRSTIQLEPAELGRLTLELVDAPEGLRAHISAEDPAVLRFLERNVQLLESEARLQGVGHMSFSVGADVSGGLGRGDQRQSEAEASFRKTIEWNTAPQTKHRSHRELDTNA